MQIRVIIESPYKGADWTQTETNIKYARAAMKDSLARGEAPFASHLLYTQEDILDDKIPGQRQQGIDAGLAWGAHADLVAFYTDLGWSEGMLRAKEHHRAGGQENYGKVTARVGGSPRRLRLGA